MDFIDKPIQRCMHGIKALKCPKCFVIQPMPQRQDSLIDQLKDLIPIANRLGMYDAADYLTKLIENKD